jgi:hypothetical protein
LLTAAVTSALPLGIVTTATFAYIASGYRLEVCFVLLVSLLLIAVIFACSPLMFIAADPELRTAFQVRVRAYAEAQEQANSQSLVRAAFVSVLNATPSAFSDKVLGIS